MEKEREEKAEELDGEEVNAYLVRINRWLMVLIILQVISFIVSLVK